MSQTPVEPQPAAPTTEPAAPTAPESQQTPPWGDDFNAEKAWSLITNLRSDKEKLSAREFLTPEQKQKLAEYDKLAAASQTELEKAQGVASKVPALEAENMRLQVAIEKGLIGDRADLAKRLNGDTLDDLRADADALLALIPAATTSTVPRPNPAQGATSTSPETGAPQLTENDLSRMTSDQIAEALEKGQLTALGYGVPR